MRKVTADAFWRAINPQNVHPTPEGPYPYTSVFKTPGGEVRGRIERHVAAGSYPPVEQHYLPEVSNA